MELKQCKFTQDYTHSGFSADNPDLISNKFSQGRDMSTKVLRYAFIGVHETEI